MVTVRCQMKPEAIREAQRRLKAAGGKIRAHQASIGIHEEDGEKPKRDYHGKDGVETLAQAMMQHEFGMGDVPERSFLRVWFDQRVSILANGMRVAMERELQGNATAVEDWVRATHAEWKAWIATGPFAGLEPITVKEKAKAGLPEPNVPLMATHQFREAWKAKLDGRSVASGSAAGSAGARAKSSAKATKGVKQPRWQAPSKSPEQRMFDRHAAKLARSADRAARLNRGEDLRRRR